jgi:hypothetical protein
MPTNLTDVEEFSDPISVPVDADPGDAASVEAPFQQLANRTRYLLDVLRGAENLYDLVAENRSIYISPAAFVPLATSAGATHWYDTAGSEPSLTSRVNTGLARCDVRGLLPDGATVISMSGLYDPGASRTGTDRMRVRLYERVVNFSVAAVSARTELVDVPQGASDALQAVGSGVVSALIDSSKLQFFELIAGNDGGSTPDIFHGLLVTFRYPGPRSF